MYVYAKEAGTLLVDGKHHRVSRGQAWPADDPVVKAHPYNFSEEPPNVGGSVERATARPGEKRDTRRAR